MKRRDIFILLGYGKVTCPAIDDYAKDDGPGAV